MKNLLVVLIVCIMATAARAETIRISAAASMTDLINDLIAGFSLEHPGAGVLPVFASSGSLAKQISMGAPADIYISANPRWMSYLDEEEMVVHASIRTLAHNKLVFISADKQLPEQLLDLPRLKTIAIGSPAYVPAGSYAKQALVSAGIYDQLLNDGKLVFAKDARQALLYADRGEVDGAFVYLTDARLSRNASIRFAVAGELYPEIAYPVALTRTGADKLNAKLFYDYIFSNQAAAVLRRYGFEPAF